MDLGREECSLWACEALGGDRDVEREVGDIDVALEDGNVVESLLSVVVLLKLRYAIGASYNVSERCG